MVKEVKLNSLDNMSVEPASAVKWLEYSVDSLLKAGVRMRKAIVETADNIKQIVIRANASDLAKFLNVPVEEIQSTFMNKHDQLQAGTDVTLWFGKSCGEQDVNNMRVANVPTVLAFLPKENSTNGQPAFLLTVPAKYDDNIADLLS